MCRTWHRQVGNVFREDIELQMLVCYNNNTEGELSQKRARAVFCWQERANAEPQPQGPATTYWGLVWPDRLPYRSRLDDMHCPPTKALQHFNILSCQQRALSLSTHIAVLYKDRPTHSLPLTPGLSQQPRGYPRPLSLLTHLHARPNNVESKHSRDRRLAAACSAEAEPACARGG